jgi:hypothetical protein
LLNDMTVGSRDSSILQIDFSRRPGLAYNHAAFKQTGVSTFLSLDGQSNHVLGLSVPTNGEWFSRGVRAPNLASWAARNGVLLAQTGDPVVTPVTGPAEHWGGDFFAVTGNRKGDWVLVGQTDNPDITRDDVVVLNGTEILVREGDPIDLDGNGLYDDNVFIGRGNNVSAAFATDRYFALTDEGALYFFANLRNGQGQDLSPGIGPPLALLRLVTVRCVGDITADGQINIVDLLAVISNWGQTGTNPADVNGDGIVNIADLLAVIAGWGPCD